MMNRNIDFDNLLDQDQLKAVKSTKQFIRVIAGAGSGKTRVLTYRFAYLLTVLEVPIDKILCVTFTKDAAAEMRKRISDITGIKIQKNIRTLNSLGNKIVRDEISRIGWKEDYDVFGDDESLYPVYESIVNGNEWMLEGGDKDKQFDFETSKQIILEMKQAHFEPKKDFPSYLPYLTESSQEALDEQIEAAKENANKNDFYFYSYIKQQFDRKFLDYMDQVSLPLLMFEEDKELCEIWTNKYDYVLVDEFQDISYLNYKLCDVLVGTSGNLFVVGDPDQNIYTWRDASQDIVNGFPKMHTGLDDITIMTNYRCPYNVVETAKKLINCNKREHPSETVAFDKDVSIDIKYYHAKTNLEEANWVADKIAQLVEEGVEYKDIAILYRTHKSTENTKKALDEKDIPFYAHTGEKPLYERRVVKAVLSVMRFLSEENEDNFNSMMNYVKDYLPEQKAFIDDLMDEDTEDGQTHLESFKKTAVNEEAGEDYEFAESYLAMIREAQKMDQRVIGYEESTLRSLLDIILSGTGINQCDNDLRSRQFSGTIQALKDDIDALLKQKDGEPVTVKEYLEHCDLELDLDRQAAESESRVQLYTIHAVKGLEFDHVFIIRANEDVLPLKYIKSTMELEEERRLAYVAFTRAHKQLYISDAGMFTNGEEGDEIECYPSRFIINDTGLERYTLISKNELTPEYIEAAKERIAKREGFLRYCDYAKTMDGFELEARVEHILFGLGTLVKLRPFEGAIDIKFDNLQKVLTITDIDKVKLLLPEGADEEVIPEDLKSLFDDNPDDTELRKRFREVLSLINRSAADPEHRDKTTVLPLMCGVGKSSAISLKIVETIEAYKQGSHSGILILSNNRAQLSRYLNAADPIVRAYIRQNRNLITLINTDEPGPGKITMRTSPVLIITTQRYTSLQDNKIKDYLTFGKGYTRDLILVDEEPPEYLPVTISANELNDISTAFSQGLSDTTDQDDKAFCQEEWARYHKYLTDALSRLEKEMKAAKHKRGLRLFLPDYKHPENNPWSDRERSRRFWKLVDTYYTRLDHIGNRQMNNYRNLDAIRLMLFGAGAIYKFVSEEESNSKYDSSFHTTIVNDPFFGVKANPWNLKIIILDGTGDIGCAYDKQDLFYVDTESSKRFDYALPNLTINIYDGASGKSTLRDQDNLNPILFSIRKQIKDAPPESGIAVFTHKRIEDKVITSLQQKDKTILVEHFGNIRGKNDYSNCDIIYQIGQFRFPAEHYLYLGLVNAPYTDYLFGLAVKQEDTTSFLLAILNDKNSPANKCMYRMLLADIEQCVFRSKIRISADATVEYNLILSFREYANLIPLIKERFTGRYKAKVEIKNRIDGEQPKTVPGKFFVWYSSLPVGTEYTTEEIKEIVQLSPSADLSAYTNPHMKAILRKDKKKRGHFVKQE